MNDLDFSQSWRAVLFGRVWALKGPNYPAVFSERDRRGVRVLPLLKGWRVTVRKIVA